MNSSPVMTTEQLTTAVLDIQQEIFILAHKLSNLQKQLQGVVGYLKAKEEEDKDGTPG